MFTECSLLVKLCSNTEDKEVTGTEQASAPVELICSEGENDNYMICQLVHNGRKQKYRKKEGHSGVLLYEKLLRGHSILTEKKKIPFYSTIT